MSTSCAVMRSRGLRSASELAANRPHGDRLRYMAGCRCEACRGANTAYEKVRAAARKAGDWNGLVDATPAREHIDRLSAAGVGYKQVADAAGVASSILYQVKSGVRTRLRAKSARAILSVTKEAMADHALVDARPSWKLLNELIATGYSKANLALALGYATPALQLGKRRCTLRNAHDVLQLHARLRRVPARKTIARIFELREEGYRHRQILTMAADLAQQLGIQVPDLNVYGDFINAGAADLIERLHRQLTQEPA